MGELRLEHETHAHRVALDAEMAGLGVTSPSDYVAYVERTYSYVKPIEESLAAPAFAAVLDPRRFRKHSLLEHDLVSLGRKAIEVRCMPVPPFGDVHTALGWAYVIERSTLAQPTLFRELALRLPREAAFASSYLKCYAGQVADMWRTFIHAIEAACVAPTDLEAVIEATRDAYERITRWRQRESHVEAPFPQIGSQIAIADDR